MNYLEEQGSMKYGEGHGKGGNSWLLGPVNIFPKEVTTLLGAFEEEEPSGESKRNGLYQRKKGHRA